MYSQTDVCTDSCEHHVEVLFVLNSAFPIEIYCAYSFLSSVPAFAQTLGVSPMITGIYVSFWLSLNADTNEMPLKQGAEITSGR